MDPAFLIPSPDVLPAPWWVFYPLLIATFTLHLVLANLLVGGAVIALVDNLRSRGPLGRSSLGGELAHKLPMAAALTVNLGVPPLLFMQLLHGQFIYTSAVLMAVVWVSIFLLAIGGYYLLYIYDIRYQPMDMGRVLTTLGAALLMSAVGYMFTASLVLMINPGAWSGYFQNAAGTIVPSGDASLAPRYLHFFFSSLALGGLGLAVWGLRRRKADPAGGEVLVNQGLRWYGLATLVNFLIGALYLGTLPDKVLATIIVGGGLGLFTLLGGVLAGLASVLAAFGGMVKQTAVWSGLSVVLMVLFRYQVRAAYLQPYLALDRLPLATQGITLIVFLVVLVLGLITVGYMLRLVWPGRKGARS